MITITQPGLVDSDAVTVAANTARVTGYSVRLVMLRQPGVVALARTTADALDLAVASAISADHIVVRFCAVPDAE